ncbi:MAG: peptidoglycan recognition family protein [Planctomycetota bacterium]|nr:peptidoglycan recognition family protein [Planctomycetota bacterium]MDG1983313.1 peptidoglycan recognition family protein [Planctomycetota bacterium]
MSTKPVIAAALALLSLTACASEKPLLAAEVMKVEPNESIIACGEEIYVGAPVILWDDPLGYNAYSTDYHFEQPPASVSSPERGELRYAPGRVDRGTGEVLVKPETGGFLALQRALDMFVIHYDVCGVSQTCFRVLHDRRGLSVHFMIDIDGTIYQTLDLRDTAWHARQVNSRSVGVEIANVGAYPLGSSEGKRILDRWYRVDQQGPRITPPGDPEALGVLTPGFVGRPARDRKIVGPVQGETREQYDFTAEQYNSLVKLTAALCRHFPELEADAPRNALGRVTTARMSEAEEAEFGGIVGHYHVSAQKQDPGPAFDWERFLVQVQTRLLRL